MKALSLKLEEDIFDDMKIDQFEIWLANLNPGYGTEPGKTRPVVIIQSNFLNNSHPSIIVCPASTNIVMKT